MFSPFVLSFVVHSFAYEKRVKERRGGGGRQEEKKKEKEKTCAESAPRILSLCSFEREKNQNIDRNRANNAILRLRAFARGNASCRDPQEY